jgi:hypothetical protein
MNFQQKIILLLIALLLSFISSYKAQEDETENTDTNTVQRVYKTKGFHAGLYVGAFWANKSTAYIYDGYGFDINGQRNTFTNSILYNQIVNVYGSGNGGTDYIAQLLNVNPGDWYFNEQDMPINLRYITTYLIGLNTRYRINNKESITLNAYGTKLAINGKFTISSVTSTNFGSGSSSQGRINEFTIIGAEQRLMFQLGYQRILGDNEKLNFMVEGGLNIILAKAQKNQAILRSSNPNLIQNSITIDLMNIYNQPPYNFYTSKNMTGVGIGFFGGFGLNLNINPRYSIQLLYSPSFDRISLGYNPKFKLQNAVGLRVYYNFSR